MQPALLDPQVALEPQQRVEAGIKPPVKKCRPIQLSSPAGLERIHQGSVREDVHE